ncbi:hypothetical protein BKA57DRAFT_437334 [Linnemannia elongata]|nr:hypothetical protein BKA57DRAFT_437334 [Linnemannia elongata]
MWERDVSNSLREHGTGMKGIVETMLVTQKNFLGLCAVGLIDYSAIILIIIYIIDKVVVLGVISFLLGVISFLLGVISFLLGIIVFLLGIIVSLLGIIIFLLGIIVFLLGIIVFLISDNDQGFELGLDCKYVNRWGFFVGYDDIWKGGRRVVVVDLSWSVMNEHIVVGH